MLKAAVTGGNGLAYLVIFFYPRGSMPTAEASAWVLDAFTWFNTLSLVFMLAVLAYVYSWCTEQAEADLGHEHQRSERLLRNILPAAIAERLKGREETIAEEFKDASVLFFDIVGFTPLAGKVPAHSLVRVLNDIFCRADDLVQQHGLEKIKTIGDAYLVASGVPKPRSDHAEAIADLALDLLEASCHFPAPVGEKLSIRVGIHSGPMVAGVIGKRKSSYDIWGDTVNTASRMESHGLPGKIQVTDSTRNLPDAKFQFKERGLLDVRGKGLMRTWFLVDRR
jgi:adenylate cyclase